MDVVVRPKRWCSTTPPFITLSDRYYALPSIHKLHNGMSDHLEDKFNVNKWEF
jgi:hypothetical protein